MKRGATALGAARTMALSAARLFLVWLLWTLATVWGLGLGSGGLVQASEVRNPDGVAVIVGNKDYSEVGDVAYAHRDAEAIYRYVVDVLGFDPRNVRLVMDADFGKMRSLFGTEGRPGILGRFVEKRHELSGGENVSDVVVFYSGHGLPSLTPGEAGSYLVAVDANPHDPAHNGYSVEELYRVLGALPARSVSVFLDACFSGVGGDGTPLLRASPAAATQLPENVGANTVVLAAAEAQQIAFWDDEAGHGLFTHHLLDALYGGGDENDDGSVTAGEVHRYLAEHVWYAALDTHGREQDAVLIDGTGTGATVLSAALDGSFPARPDLDASDPVAVAASPESDGRTEDSGDSPPRAPDLAALTGGNAVLTVKTTPPGAAVFVGDAGLGQTPIERYDLRAGTYTVTLDHPTHETVILEDQTLADHRVLRIERTLAPATGSVTVITQPSGSWVEHEGARLAESTPVTLEGLPSGLLVLTLVAEGHRPERVEVLVPKGGVALVEQVLEVVQYGTLTLELEPADAQAELIDDDTPYRAGMRLAEGERRVLVRREGYSEVSRTVTVSGETRERIVLEPAPQPFTVLTTPADATVRFVDGGEAYRPGMELLPGTYRVQVSAEGWETQEASIRHEASSTRHAVTLKRAWNPATDEAALELERSEKRLVQEGLAAKGFDPGQPDGLIGGNTRQALRGWQAKQGHEATGYLTAVQAKELLAAGEGTVRKRAEEERGNEAPPAEERQGTLLQAEEARQAASAAPLKPFGSNWIVVENQGCQVYNPYPEPGATVAWTGACVDGKASGHGQLVWRYSLGEGVYQGNLRAGKMTGYGTYVWPNGDRYEGEWQDGLPHGRGLSTRSDGSRYEGALRDGKAHGQGTLTWLVDGRYEGINGRYEGAWREDKRHGSGTQTWPSGDRYEGEWRDDKRHGTGTQSWTNGSRYNGEWRDDKPHGYGTLTLTNGKFYRGQWRIGCFRGPNRSWAIAATTKEACGFQ